MKRNCSVSNPLPGLGSAQRCAELSGHDWEGFSEKKRCVSFINPTAPDQR
jgi:hypothetical protein